MELRVPTVFHLVEEPGLIREISGFMPRVTLEAV
jgi:hypothetical protein